MDTHINGADILHGGVGLGAPIGLPGEVDDRGGHPPEPPFSSTSADPEEPPTSPSVKPQRRGRRKLLLAGIAALVLGATGTSALLFSDNIVRRDFEHISLHDARLPASMVAWIQARRQDAHALATWIAETHHDNRRPVPEAAIQLANTSVKQPAEVATRTQAAQPSAAPAGPAPDAPANAVAEQQTAVLAELATLKPAVKPETVPTTVAPPSPADVVAVSPATLPAKGEAVAVAPTPTAAPCAQEAGLAAFPAAPALPQPAPLQPTKLADAVPAASPAPGPVLPSTPHDAIASIAELQAAPMTPKQQVEVLGLVKSLGAQLRDTRIEVAQLQQTASRLAEEVEAKTTEFDNRLTLAEAAAMVQSSDRAGRNAEHDAPPSPALPSQSLRLTTHTLGPVSATPPPSPAPVPAPKRRTVKDYVVKGASPGLAVLSALNPVTGSASVLEVGVGDAVPGVGKIRRVYQRGTIWVVETENGSIQQ